MYKLTSAGTTYISKFQTQHVKDPELAVMLFIQEEREPVTLEELTGYFRSTDDTMQKIVNRCINKGFMEDNTRDEK